MVGKEYGHLVYLYRRNEGIKMKAYIVSNLIDKGHFDLARQIVEADLGWLD